VKFSNTLKEEMAFALRALKKEITGCGNLTFDGHFENSHCDRTWPKPSANYAPNPAWS